MQPPRFGNDFPQALRIVERIGNSRSNGASEYREWPLYQELRKRTDFAELFEKIFGRPLDFIATVPSGPAPDTDDTVDPEIESLSNEASSVRPTNGTDQPTRIAD